MIKIQRQRMMSVNSLIVKIGSCGREFLYHAETGRYSQFEDISDLYYRDHYTGKIISATDPWWYVGTSGGGTLQDLVKQMAIYITTGQKLTKYQLGPWDGLHWGYGDAMADVTATAQKLGILERQNKNRKITRLFVPCWETAGGRIGRSFGYESEEEAMRYFQGCGDRVAAFGQGLRHVKRWIEVAEHTEIHVMGPEFDILGSREE